MKNTFGRSDKVRAASKVALEKLRSLSSRELLAVGAKHVDSDISIMFTESAADYPADYNNGEDAPEYSVSAMQQIVMGSVSGLMQLRHQVLTDVYAQAFHATRELVVAYELSGSYRIAGAMHAPRILEASREESLEYISFFGATDNVPALIKCVAA